MSTAADPTATFLAALKGTGLLAADQFRDLLAWAQAARPDPGTLAKEIHRRGWLTPYQIKQTYRGQGADLRLGRYVLLDLLGEGGMGRVFKAHDTKLGRDVALKVIRRERLTSPAAMARFEAEMQALGKLAHPNVVAAFDAGRDGDTHFVVMEFIDGADLTKVVGARGPLPVAEACEHVRQAALGLQHAHENGLVHRDVKPSNLIATRDGKAVKLVDLGLARLNDAPPADGRVTQEGFVIGTPDFLAPEQARDPLGVDIRADVYALGGTLYFLLTGRPPYDGATPADKLVQHCTAPPPGLLALRPDAPPEVERIIHWCLAKRPADRPQTPAELAAALLPYCDPAAGPVGYPTPAPFAPPHPAAEPAADFTPTDDGSPLVVLSRRPSGGYRRPTRGGPPVGLIIAAVAAVAVAGVLAAFAFRKPADPPPPAGPPEPFTNAAGMRLVVLNGGAFRMGSARGEPGRPRADKGRPDDEGPPREVAVSGPLLVGATEVTHAQWARVMGGPPPQSAVLKKAHTAADLPADMVSWDDAVAFCRKLTDLDQGRPHARAGWAYRLPTEAEWEYACRAGTDGPFWTGGGLVNRKQGLYSPTGDEPALEAGSPAERAVGDLPGKVGSHPPNPWGLFDTHGNVAEWCQDWYAPYPPPREAGRDDPTGPPAGEKRVVRGGSFRSPASACRSAARDALRPADRREDVGFRVVYAPAR